MLFSDMSYYSGDFYNGYRHGYGSMIMAESPQIYNGSWYCGQRNGEGWMLFEPGNWYEGEWKDGLMDGYGMRQYASGNMYYGEWKNGLRHGQGVAVLKNNDVLIYFYFNYQYKTIKLFVTSFTQETGWQEKEMVTENIPGKLFSIKRLVFPQKINI